MTTTVYDAEGGLASISALGRTVGYEYDFFDADTTPSADGSGIGLRSHRSVVHCALQTTARVLR